MKHKIIRISTVPSSINVFLRGFLKKLSEEYEVVAISSPGVDLECVSVREGVKIIPVPMQRRISVLCDFISLLRLIKVLYKEKPDIVHSITPKAGLLTMVAAWITRVPVRIHTFTGLVFPTSTGFKKQILILMDKITCACATYINPEGKGVALDLLNNNITKKDLHIIANGNIRGVDMDYYNRTPEVCKKAEEIANKSMFSFIFIGRLVKDKGINELLCSFNKLSEKYENVRLILVGEQEPEHDPLNNSSITILENNDKILAVGRQDDVRPWLVASDVLVFPSYREGFPNVVLEAGALELPSIVTNINGSNEIIIHGVNGEIIPSKDSEALFNKMEEWYNNRAKVKIMASNSRKLVGDRYEQKMVWTAIINEYKRLLNI